MCAGVCVCACVYVCVCVHLNRPLTKNEIDKKGRKEKQRMGCSNVEMIKTKKGVERIS